MASTKLQKIDQDLSNATNLLKVCLTNVKDLRDKFSDILTEAKLTCQKWGIDIQTFSNKRARIVKKHYDELSIDYRFNNAEDMYKVNVFFRVVDIVTQQLRTRFEGMFHVSDSFMFLEPQRLSQLNDLEIIENADKLKEKYEKDISAAFALQLVLLKNTFKSELDSISTIRDLLHLILIKHVELSSSFTEVISVLVLFLTLPVTVASAERSFSKLKLIKSFLRSTMSQDRIKALGLLSIEAEEASKMDVSELVMAFANHKARRKEF